VKWSFSHRATFKRCQRQWYYKYILANAIAKDPLRHEAHRLSKLVGINAWKGKLVDEVISEVFVSSFNRGIRLSFDRMREAASTRFKRATGLRNSYRTTDSIWTPDSPYPTFLEDEYGEPLTAEVFETVWAEIEHALRTFSANQKLFALLNGSTYVIAQRIISFKHDGTTVTAVPDLIAFFAKADPLIVDWKVYRNPVGDSWFQLATYAVALTRCGRHRDWPVDTSRYLPSQIRLVEVQLLTNDTRVHNVTSEDVEELEDLISESALEMRFACDGRRGTDLLREDFPVPFSSKPCQRCSFRKLCG
jgi:hypothetical protein